MKYSQQCRIQRVEHVGDTGASACSTKVHQFPLPNNSKISCKHKSNKCTHLQPEKKHNYFPEFIWLHSKSVSTGWFFKTIVSTVRLNSLCTLSSFKTLKGEHTRSLIFSHADQQFFTTGAEWHFTAFRSVSEARHLLPKFTIGFRIKTHSVFGSGQALAISSVVFET